MSLHRENVTWQSPEGTWSIGFFAFEEEDDDYEWGVYYDHGHFWWASTGHPNPDAAMDAYMRENANPGCTVIVAWSEKEAENIARYERMAADRKAEHDRLTADADLRPTWERYPHGFPAAPRQRSRQPLRVRPYTRLK
ncbi:hypothetical protein [Kitasatospora cineracea]|uniref:hypothetical protein n=1 Tax=Kitasatospora cineracea TaxID=88074 RepID=UPI0036D0D091